MLSRPRMVVASHLRRLFHTSSFSRSSSELVTCGFEREGRVAVLRLNDPQRLNALTEDMGDCLSGHVAELKDHKGLRVAVITGEGEA